MAKKETSEPDLETKYRDACVSLTAARAQIAELEKHETPEEKRARLSALRETRQFEARFQAQLEQAGATAKRETEAAKADAKHWKAEAEQNKLGAARLAKELAAANDELLKLRRMVPAGLSADPYAHDPKARGFLYVKGDPKQPTSPRKTVRATTQAQADERAAPLLAEGFAFRGYAP